MNVAKQEMAFRRFRLNAFAAENPFSDTKLLEFSREGDFFGL